MPPPENFLDLDSLKCHFLRVSRTVDKYDRDPRLTHNGKPRKNKNKKQKTNKQKTKNNRTINNRTV